MAIYKIRGFTDSTYEHLIGNFSLLKTKAARAGFLNALYVFRSHFLPPAYERTSDIDELQQMINQACALLCDKIDSGLAIQ